MRMMTARKPQKPPNKMRFTRYLGKKRYKGVMLVYFRNHNGGWNKSHGTVENTPRLDSFDAATVQGWGDVFCGNAVIDAYRDGNCLLLSPAEPEEIELELSRKRNGYGGQQTFFLCPGCGRRVRYLYLSKRMPFLCRKCARLNYKSQQQTRDSMTDYFKGMKLVEERLALPPWPIDGFSFVAYTPDKPKWMHRATYLRYLSRFFKYRERYARQLIADMERIAKPFG